MPIRLAASLTAAAMLCACSGTKNAAETSATASPTATPQVAAPALGPPGPARGRGGPPNALISLAGTPAGIPLEAGQRREVAAIAAKQPRAVRDRLRYALASGDDGKTHLVVYDGEGLPADGRHPGKPHEYVVFRVLNSARNEHYDPQQNALVAPLPPPRARETTETIIR
ncbi:MAG TPA: hypothetical protein VK669_03370 [Candidatus Limnocylindrales bacterium]|nr:hypothetical protein [Candidatus Limnocylindrales bacterium]